MQRQLRIAFLSGPANVSDIYREWQSKDLQEYFGTDYMKQFLQVATDVGADCKVVTWYGDKPSVWQVDNFCFVNRPLKPARGVRYYLGMIWWHLTLLPMLLRYRPDVLLLTGNQNFWWLLAPVRWAGAKIVISYHAVVWPMFSRPSRVWRALVAANRLFILRHAKAILETSHYIRRQIVETLGGAADRVPVLAHLPTYSPAQFAAIAPATFPVDGQFRVFFLGRIETNKGIYDIVEMARYFEEKQPGRYRFDLCGSGGELARLRATVAEQGLEESVVVHGFASNEKVRELLSASHACIVPTRTDYEAGFEMTCSESILAGRPLITSAVCPAIEYLRSAVVEAKPDDAMDYAQAIERLSGDQALFEEKRDACPPLQAQFYDRANSWYAQMRIALDRYVIGSGTGAPAERPALARDGA